MSEDSENNKPHDGVAESIGKHVAGGAMLSAATAVAGLAYGVATKSSLKNSAALGAGIGALGSLGFGKTVYEAVTGPSHPTESHAQRILAERQKPTGRER